MLSSTKVVSATWAFGNLDLATMLNGFQGAPLEKRSRVFVSKGQYVVVVDQGWRYTNDQTGTQEPKGGIRIGRGRGTKYGGEEIGVDGERKH